MKTIARHLLIFILLFSCFHCLFCQNTDESKSTIVFYRPARMSASVPPFTIGSVVPDTLFKGLKNGKYCSITFREFREWEFIGGLYKHSAKLKLTIEPGKTYYVRCRVKDAIPASIGLFELVDEAIAKKDMQKLKEQTD